IEKIAANAVMAGCTPDMMRALVPVVRAVCDERFNIHGVQATTHFAAPLIVVNGPVRKELGFACGQNVFSNVARANSTLGRALQTVWSYRTCLSVEALVVIGPEHVKTIHGDGFDKRAAREFLFERTGIPVRAYDEEGEGMQQARQYREITIDGERCYQKFRSP